ncbi:PTS sugar transporter subunit IIA [Candidatus Latescibacterota bacterium]
MKNISDMLTVDMICDLRSDSKDDALNEMIEMASKSPRVSSSDALHRAIRYRENIMSTGVGLGIAIPHAKISSVTDFVIALGRSTAGIEYESLDGKPVHLIILIAASDTQGEEFLKLLAKIGTVFNKPGNIKKVLEAKTSDKILTVFKKIEQ